MSNVFTQQISPHDGCSIVIFGASGDLSKKKLFPSFYQLYIEGKLPKKFRIIGYARTKMSQKKFITQLKEKFDYENDSFFSHIGYISGSYKDCDEMHSLHTLFEKYSLNRIFYFSLPPEIARSVCRGLKKLNLITKNSGGQEYAHTIIGQQAYTRLVLEKPFGTDYESATKLSRFLRQHFSPAQIFIIDHYLGKEPIQNILFFRFANSIFENMWNSNYIENIELSLLENIGLANRAGYFDNSGILKDMIQSHGLQVLSLILMEPPYTYDAEEIQKEKSKALSALRLYTSETVVTDVVRGQYEGYLEEKGVSNESCTETAIALKTYVDNWRWSGVPIYLRSGKCMHKSRTELVINFKNVPHNIFGKNFPVTQNKLVFRFQPDTFITINVNNKVPGINTIIKNADLEFPYAKEFKGLSFVNGYDRIIYNVLINDATLSLSMDEIFAQWKFVDSIKNSWSKNTPLYSYKIASSGPDEMHTLLEKEGHSWNT